MTSRPFPIHGLQGSNPKVLLLVSPPYVLSLGALLLNDFFLKRAYPGLVTGKLSDFAGLFALGVFLLIFTRRPGSLLALASCFVVWKFPVSDTAIQAWNAVTGLTVGRTVDPTDLVALSVLPLAWLFYRTADAAAVMRKGWCGLSLAVSLFAFTATPARSTPEQLAAYHAAIAEFEFTDHQPSYRLSLSRKKLYQALEAHGFSVNGGVEVLPNTGQHDAYLVPRGPRTIRPSSKEPELFGASFEVDNTKGGVTLRLTKLSIKKAGQPVSQADAVRIFESNVLAGVR